MHVFTNSSLFLEIIESKALPKKKARQKRSIMRPQEKKINCFWRLTLISKSFSAQRSGMCRHLQKQQYKLATINSPLSATHSTSYEFQPKYLLATFPNFQKGNSLRHTMAIKTVRGLFSWDFIITLTNTKQIAYCNSPSHKQITKNINQGLQLQLGENSLPNKDFTLLFTTVDFHLPTSVVGRSDIGCSAMISFIPKYCDFSVNDAYKAALAGKTFETDTDNARGQYVFVLDRSGSMEGSRTEKAKEALILFIKSLPQDSYFNVVSFGSDFSSLTQGSAKYMNETVESALLSIQHMSADMGGTEIYHPVESIIKNVPIKDYPKQIFLLTDGEVSDTNRVIDLCRKCTKYARVHSIGIGSGASEALIQDCAEKGKGYSVFIDDEDPVQKIIQMLTDSLTPVIRNFKLKYDPTKLKPIIPNPESLPCILKNDVVNFYVTFQGSFRRMFSSHSLTKILKTINYASEVTILP